MNQNKVIKDLKERNNRLQDQYRLRDLRCIHLEKENQELKVLNRRYKEVLSDNEENYKIFSSEINDLKSQQEKFIKYLEDEIYSIEPKGTSINYNCEYDSEEDYINSMKKQSRLNTLKEILSKYKEII